MKAQFIWPFKAGYWVVELADDYSYVVVGHPDKKYLFIMARDPQHRSRVVERNYRAL
jgi:apolipoprotein D and lipocalin family protein